MKVVETTDLFRADQTWWAEVLSDIDTVIHLAWYAKPGQYLMSQKNLDCSALKALLRRGFSHDAIARAFADAWLRETETLCLPRRALSD
jgi:dTDP-6-deoxy-L-talose 4-dehydrogenase (NAD+)